VALRLSKNKFTGKGGTDTGNRLFNTIRLDLGYLQLYREHIAVSMVISRRLYTHFLVVPSNMNIKIFGFF